MKLLAATILLLLCLTTEAQIPPAIQWQKCYGGTNQDYRWLGGRNVIATSDGGYICALVSFSNDGDLPGNYGLEDVWVVKTDVTGNIQWQKIFGGSSIDHVHGIVQAADGGYVLIGSTVSADGDVTGNHGFHDLWLVKLSAAGVLQWQKTYGGSLNDVGTGIQATTDGGYILSGTTGSSDGDIIGYHGGTSDTWVLKVDANGNMQWNKCFGGSREDNDPNIIQTSDGGYFLTVNCFSTDGDLTCGSSSGFRWVVKMDNAANIQWQQCFDIGFAQARQTTDGGFIIAGYTVDNRLQGYHGGADLIFIKTDAAGIVQWQKLMGGSSSEYVGCIELTADGGYIVSADSRSQDGDLCSNKGGEDVWIIKLNGTGTVEWKKTYGGSNRDITGMILPTPDGGYMIGHSTLSNDGDVSGNHTPGRADFRLFKLSFPGVPVFPLVSITASTTVICPGQKVTFVATPTDGGSAPSYQWKINGINTATDNDTVIINTFSNGDVVSCVLTSNSACVTSPTAVSNTIAITVDPSRVPANFLPPDTVICGYGTLDLKPTGNYQTYLWSNNAITPVLTISQPGTYWLNVTTNTDCPGSDTIRVAPKDCLKGFFMPTAFTPNGDGRNDVLRPIIGGNVRQYKFTVTNRWGQVIFQTSETGKGWDGKFNALVQDSNVFVWTCMYQLEGEEIKYPKGTVVIIR